MSAATAENASALLRTRAPDRPRGLVGRELRIAALAAVLAVAMGLFLVAPVAGSGLAARTAWSVGGTFCHQLPERSLHVEGRALPVCARCAGLLVGGAGALLVLTIGAVAGVRVRPGRRSLIAALAALGVHVAWGAAGLPDGGLAARFLIGAVAAAVFAPHVAGVLAAAAGKAPGPRRSEP